jgi:carbon-monoxide dehydrogenase small subunit
MKISFILNNRKTHIEIDPEKPLLRVLKDDLGIDSVKEGCGRGECGTCTVLLDDEIVTSCVIPAAKVRGKKVTTLEGLEKAGEIQNIQQAFMETGALEKAGEIQNIQQAFMETGAVQCGFCTPGFIMSAYVLLKSNKSPSREDIRQAISGNLCRCTGYTKIINAVKRASEMKEN